MKLPLIARPLGIALAIALFASDSQCTRALAEGETTKMHVYVGCYTKEKGNGIQRCELDLTTGQLVHRGVVAEVVNPSFLAIHPGGKYLYAVNEVASFGEVRGGAVGAFVIDHANGRLTPINQQSSKGAGPCHLVVDKAGKNVLVANYGGGNAAVLPIREDGGLEEASAFVQHKGSSVNKQRQEGPHAHSINLDPANKFAFIADLGLDKVMVYHFDVEHGKIAPNDPPSASVAPGAGPRHFAFHPSGKFAFVINELSSTLTSFRYDAELGKLVEADTESTLPHEVKGNSTAEVQVHPSGKFVYGSNRGHNSIAIFKLGGNSGEVIRIGNEPTQGGVPRNFGIDPTGKFLLAANQDTGTIVVFRIDQETGKLTATGSQVKATTPVCVKFLGMAAN